MTSIIPDDMFREEAALHDAQYDARKQKKGRGPKRGLKIIRWAMFAVAGFAFGVGAMVICTMAYRAGARAFDSASASFIQWRTGDMTLVVDSKNNITSKVGDLTEADLRKHLFVTLTQYRNCAETLSDIHASSATSFPLYTSVGKAPKQQ